MAEVGRSEHCESVLIALPPHTLTLTPSSHWPIMAIDNFMRVYARRAQLSDDAVLRPCVLNREGWRDWPAPVDLFHVGSFRLPPSFSLMKNFLDASSYAPVLGILLFRSICLSFVLKTDGVCDRSGGLPDCSCIKASTQSMGKRGFHFGVCGSLAGIC